MSPIEAFEEIIAAAWIKSDHHSYQLQKCITEGKPIPDYLKPGGLLKMMPQNLLDALKGLTSDEVSKFGWIFYNGRA